MLTLQSFRRAVVLGAFVAGAVFWLPMGLSARPMTVEDLLVLKRVSDPQVSPDGSQIVYVVTEVLKDENRTQSDLWLVPFSGGEPRRLASTPQHERHPRWSPDGRWIAFESNRDGKFQVWLLPMDAAGEARRLTNLSTEASQPVWSPDGRLLACVSSVYPEFSDKPFEEADRLNREKLEREASADVRVRVYDELLYRHWDTWSDGRRQHLFVVSVDDEGRAGEPRNVTPGPNDAVPNSMTFDAGDEFAFSVDGSRLLFSAPPDPTRIQAWSTNYDLWSVDLRTGARQRETENPAADGLPRFSPDGRWLAYRAQERAGFESDRWQLMLLDLQSGDRRSLTPELDRSIESIVWAPDSKTLYFAAQDEGTESIWQVPVAGGDAKRVVTGGVNTGLTLTSDGRALVFLRQHMNRPPEVAKQIAGQESVEWVTRTNAEALADVDLPEPERVVVTGAGGAPVQMWILKPPGYQEGRRYPLVFWVHGGPQGAFLDSWSTRWNPQVWAAEGYVLAMPNPRGSTGFGQQFTDEISRDWGGRVFEDLMACLAHLEKQPYIDTERMAAAGASYGGYMMNWFQGHTKTFKTLVTHCGVYDFIGMYGATEETWFDEWEHGIPWETPEFDKYSPHRYAANFSTPNLIIHNELDFRVPLAQGLSAFTTLQRKGIPSKLVIFPDEGHWVLKPKNSERWHQEIFSWLKGYLK